MPLHLPPGERSSHIRVDIVNGYTLIGVINHADSSSILHYSFMSDEAKAKLAYWSGITHFRRRVQEIGIANDYELFCTFTFPAVIGNDIQEVKKMISWMRNHARYKGYTLHYMAVLAPGKKGGHWHWHMLMSGIPRTELELITKDSKCLTSSQKKRLWYQQLYHWRPFMEKYGSYHEIVRIGEIDKYGKVTTQFEKMQYMAHQYDRVPPEFLPPPRTRKVQCDRKTERPYRTLHCITTEKAMWELFNKFDSPFGFWGGRVALNREKAAAFLKELEEKDLLHADSGLPALLEESEKEKSP